MPRELPTGTVTLVFTDIEGSTGLLHELGEAYGDVLAAHRRLLREVWSAHGGTEVGTEGDAFFVAFGAAGPAVDAALDAQRALAAHAWPGGRPVRVRIGIHTGAPQVRDGQYWGEDVHYAARVAAAAHGGQTLLSATTAALVQAPTAPLGEHALKDFPVARPLFQLVHEGAAAGAFPPPRTLPKPRPTLPPGGGLVGREADVEALAARLTDGARLVTIAGPGGSGKTRLAVEVAHRVAGAFPDGAAFAALDELSDPAAVDAAVARALNLPEVAGVPAADRVADHLRGRRALLVLDNFEHLLGAAGVAARFASAGDGVRVLVTSQVPLRVAPEHVYPLAPLAEDHAVALLVERARAAAPGFALTDANAAAVRALVERLDGSPLAIELAAGRLSLLAPAELLRRLDDSLEALGRGGRDLPARQRGLRAMLDWTTSLLAEEQRRALARLSVFAGGFTLALAEDAFGEVLDDLGALLDAGLIRRGMDDRFTMSPPVRAYASALPGADDDARRAHAAAMVRLAEPFERLWMIRVAEGSAAFNPEAANLDEVLRWTRGAAPELHAPLIAGVAWWLNYADRRAEARDHLDAALRWAREPRLRARLVEAAGVLMLETADPSGCLEAAELWRELGDRGREVMARVYAANLYSHRFDGEHCLEQAAIAGDLAAASGERDLVWLAQMATGNGLQTLGRPAEALPVLQDLLAQARPGSIEVFLASTALADAELVDGDDAGALRHYGQAMAALWPTESISGQIIQACTVALALARLGRIEDAATVLGVCDVADHTLAAAPALVVAATVEEAAALVGPAARAAGRARAEAMGLEAGLVWTRDLALRA